MKANNITTIVEDSTAFCPTRFKEYTLYTVHCTLYSPDMEIHIDNGLWYIMISFILLNPPDILMDFS